jgi:DNA polymerase I-like protein with 3'-5' exonuclease and polymerase domains
MAWKGLERDTFLQDQWAKRLGLSDQFAAWDALYGCIDGAATSDVAAGHGDKLALDGTAKVYLDLHMGLRPALLEAERKGLRVDQEALGVLRRWTARARRRAERGILTSVDSSRHRARQRLVEEGERADGEICIALARIPRCPEHPAFVGLTTANCKDTKKRRACPRCVDVRLLARPIHQAATKSAGLRRLGLSRLEREKVTDSEWRRILFDDLALPPVARPDDEPSTPSVAEDALGTILAGLPHDDPRRGVILAKLKIASLDHALRVPLSPPMDELGFIHPPILSHTTGTGRCSSGATSDDSDKKAGSSYNQQNIRKSYRRIYVPSAEGRSFIEGDYSQIELWLVALFASDDRMLGLLRGGSDIHAHFAGQIFGVDPRSITKSDLRRDVGKTAGHAIRYGAAKRKVAEIVNRQCELGREVTEKEAEGWIEGYFTLFPKQHDWQQQVVAQTIRSRQLRMPSGRIRWFNGVEVKRSKKTGELSYSTSEREEIIATGPQGTAGDIWRAAVKRVHAAGLDFRGGAHDSILVEVPTSEIMGSGSRLRYLMQEPVSYLANFNGGQPWSPPADISAGPNWYYCSLPEGKAKLDA